MGGKNVDVSRNPYNDPENNFSVASDNSSLGFLIFKSGKCNMKVGFNGHGTDSVAIVSVDPKYGKKMIGLCGDCDGNRRNDLKTKGGKIVATANTKFNEISESFVVDESLENGNVG